MGDFPIRDEKPPEKNLSENLPPLLFTAQKAISITFLERFKERMKTIFTYLIADTAPLKGRVEEIYPKMQDTLISLQKVKEDIELKSKNKPEILLFEKHIVKSLIDRSQKLEERWKGEEIHHRLRVFDETKIWKDECVEWIEIYWSKNPNELLLYVKDNLKKEALKKVDRDIKIIQDYEQQTFEKLNVSSSDKQHLRDLLEELLLKPIATLGSLKQPKDELALEDLDLWNKELDEKRQKLFNETLAIIDAVVHDFKPEFAIEEDHQHLIDVIEKINLLENRLHLMQEALLQSEGNPIIDDKTISDSLLFLQNEIHELSLDLRLPQSLFERLEKAEALLTEISKKAKN